MISAKLLLAFLFASCVMHLEAYSWGFGFFNPRKITNPPKKYPDAAVSGSDAELERLLNLFESSWEGGFVGGGKDENLKDGYDSGLFESILSKARGCWNKAADMLVESKRPLLYQKFSSNVNRTVEQMSKNIPNSFEAALVSLISPNPEYIQPPNKRMYYLWEFFFAEGDVFFRNFEERLRQESLSMFNDTNTRILEAIIRGLKKNLYWGRQDRSGQNDECRLRSGGQLKACDDPAISDDAPFNSPEELYEELQKYRKSNPEEFNKHKRSFESLKSLLSSTIFRLPRFRRWLADKIDNAIEIIANEIEPEIHASTVSLINHLRAALNPTAQKAFNWFFPIGINHFQVADSGIRRWVINKIYSLFHKVLDLIQSQVQGTIANYIFAGEFKILEFIRDSMKGEIAKTIPFHLYTPTL